MTAPSLRPGGKGLPGAPAVGAPSVPSSDLSLTSRSLAVVMSVRIALEIEEVTKPRSENTTIGIARKPAHFRNVVIVGLVSLPQDASRLSAVTGFSSSASLEIGRASGR